MKNAFWKGFEKVALKNSTVRKAFQKILKQVTVPKSEHKQFAKDMTNLYRTSKTKVAPYRLMHIRTVRHNFSELNKARKGKPAGKHLWKVTKK